MPKIDKGFLVALLPVAFFHVVGHVSACLSFSQMAVSFAHIVKSAEPVSEWSSAHSGRLLQLAWQFDKARVTIRSLGSCRIFAAEPCLSKVVLEQTGQR